MSRLEIAIEQIERVRKYANSLLDNIDEADWFRQPAEGVTHIAWQVGHMTLSQYRLALRRIRGELATDAEFVPAGFQKLFGKGSTPSSDRSIHPDPVVIRAAFDNVHQRVIAETRTVDDAVLDEPVDPLHPMFSTKHGALIWAAQHEVSHVGQIGLLRRLFGNQALW